MNRRHEITTEQILAEKGKGATDVAPFADCAPRTVYATLLDEEQYLCSWRTM